MKKATVKHSKDKGKSNKGPIPEPECKLSAEALLAAANKQDEQQGKPPESSVPPSTILTALGGNEDGDSSLFIKLNKGKRLYDLYADPNFAWYYWNDHYWRQDIKKEAINAVSEVIELYGEQRQREEWGLGKLNTEKKDLSEKEKAEATKTKRIIKALKGRITALQTLKRKNSIVKLSAIGVDSLGYVGDRWDLNPWLLGCKNGVIDLETGKRRDGKPKDYIKTVSPIAWDDRATCPTWEAFLLEIFEGDQEIVNFLQRLLGYAITGLRTEHIFPIFWGERGRNGKGTIFEILKYVLGEMAYRAPTELLIQQNASMSNGSSANSALMKFMGIRLAWASEANKKDRLDSAKIKEYSGGDTISSRNPYGRKQIEFQPTHTLFLLVNPRPQVDAEDDPFWRRVILFPFNLTFVADPDPRKPWERKINKNLLDELKTEAPGIMRWLVKGTQEWKNKGLQIPPKLKAAAKEYRNEEDLFRHFLDEKCVVDEGNMTFRTKPKELYFAYKDWCQESGFKPLNQKHFNESARKKFGKLVSDCGIRTYRGVTLLTGIL
ncbi:MAG: hypothetical protein JEZ12_16050 [Desulfobacterium sp.]|nr:hypothetical protein [Desulfobacterium sp.]